MFFGQYDHNIDEKGRFTIPSRYRDLLGSNAQIVLGFENNLMVMRTEDYLKLYHKSNDISITITKRRELARNLFGFSEQVEIDSNGRILIPQFLRVKVNLGGPVKVIGVGSYFEIWPADQWAQQEQAYADGESRAEMFEDLDLTF